MFNGYLDPRSQLALMCVATAFVFWSNDLLFYVFLIMAFCTRLGDSAV
jgi:hypothetical protein